MENMEWANIKNVTINTIQAEKLTVLYGSKLTNPYFLKYTASALLYCIKGGLC